MFKNPPRNCGKCPRLAEFREENRIKFPEFFNAPVPAFGPLGARLLVVGLAPGLKGANRTGRPFTGDFAGQMLYDNLARIGLAQGSFAADPKDGYTPLNCRITNAVRCVPPQNKAKGAETNACKSFLTDELGDMPNLEIILTLGTLAHGATLAALGLKKSHCKFGHAATHLLAASETGRKKDLWLINTYHSSRYNVNTGRLTEPMFANVFDIINQKL